MKKLYTLILASTILLPAMAQTTDSQPAFVQQKHAQQATNGSGTTIGVGVDRGTPIWSEDFGTGVPAGWSILTTGNPLVEWKHTTVGHTGAYPTAALESTTAANGWMIVDSDADNVSGGTAEETELQSPAIIPSLPFPVNVKLEFEQMFREYLGDITTISVSPDSVVWTDFVINDGVGQGGVPNPDLVSLNVSPVIGGRDSCFIRFNWVGAWDYGWQIDDIAILPLPDDDLALSKVFDHDPFLKWDYSMIPLPETQNMDFGGIVKNIGLNDQANTAIDITVMQGASTLLSQTTTPMNIPSFGQDTMWINTTFQPPSVGDYNVLYSAANGAVIDNDLSDNSGSSSFEVTNIEYGKDDNVYTGAAYGAFEDASSNPVPVIIGNIYEVISTGNLVKGVKFALEDQTVVGSLITPLLFEASGPDPFTDWLEAARGDEYIITASDISGVAQEGGEPIWIELNFYPPVAVSANTLYIVGIETPSAPDEVHIAASGIDIDNGARVFGDIGTTAGNQGWYSVNRIPMVRMMMAYDVGMEENELAGLSLGQNVPNPFNGTSTVNYELTEKASINFEVRDITGKQVLARNEGVKAPGMHSITVNASDFAPGVYFYVLDNGSTRLQKQMVISE